jgi:hypothetical protein
MKAVLLGACVSSVWIAIGMQHHAFAERVTGASAPTLVAVASR